MSLSDFVRKYNGKFIDYDHAYGTQCVDLINQYLDEALGIKNPIQEFPVQYAYQFYTYFDRYPGAKLFDRILYRLGDLPSPGDLMVFNHDVPGLTGVGGHISIFLSGNEHQFTSFDQNSPEGSPCEEKVHQYYGVLGFLHYKGGEDMVTSRADLDNLYQLAFGRNADDEGATFWVGKPWLEVVKGFLESDEYKNSGINAQKERINKAKSDLT